MKKDYWLVIINAFLCAFQFPPAAAAPASLPVTGRLPEKLCFSLSLSGFRLLLSLSYAFFMRLELTIHTHSHFSHFHCFSESQSCFQAWHFSSLLNRRYRERLNERGDEEEIEMRWDISFLQEGLSFHIQADTRLSQESHFLLLLPLLSDDFLPGSASSQPSQGIDYHWYMMRCFFSLHFLLFFKLSLLFSSYFLSDVTLIRRDTIRRSVTIILWWLSLITYVFPLLFIFSSLSLSRGFFSLFHRKCLPVFFQIENDSL